MIGSAVFRMCEGRRRHYDDGFRREALKLIRAGVGYKSLARRLAMPVYTAKQWVMLYRSGGEEAVMGSRGNRRYDWETKVAAARDHVCLWSNKAVRCRHLFWTVMAFILDSVGGRHRCDMRAPVPLVS